MTTGVQVSDQPKNQQFILVTIYINACTQINVYFHFRKVELTLLSLKAVDIFKYALLLMDALFNGHEMSTCCFQQADRGAASAKSPLSPWRVKLLDGKIKYRYAHIQNQTYIMCTECIVEKFGQQAYTELHGTQIRDKCNQKCRDKAKKLQTTVKPESEVAHS